MPIKIIELFSGIGGFTKGFQDAGFQIEKHFFSEIDKHAIANYKYNFPNAEYIGSVTDFRGQRGQADVITFGSPCQDFSLAGKRAGLEGQRSSLIEQAIRIVSEIRPSIFIWENVKGAYSSNSGADFWAILQAFTNIGGYRLEWQLLNTKWFLPQNRERIYLVGHLAGSERSFKNVFPIGEEIGVHHKRNIAKPVGKAVTQTLDCACNQAVIQLNESKESGGKQPYQQNRIYAKEGISPTIDQSAGRWQTNTPNIRRLTEIECERLQGFPDDFTKFGNYDGVVKEIPKTQRYKMLGNAVTVRVVEEIAKRLIKQ